MTLALGIDPGTATTGYGLVRQSAGGALEAVDYGVFVTPPHTPAHQRLLMLFNDLTELLDCLRAPLWGLSGVWWLSSAFIS